MDESKNREKSGFDLGLSIAKKLAASNGYSLILVQNYIQDSRFVLENINT